MTDIINNTSHCAVSPCISWLMCWVTQKTYFSFGFLFLMVFPKLPFMPVQAVWNVNSAQWWGKMLLSTHILYQTCTPTSIHKQRHTRTTYQTPHTAAQGTNIEVYVYSHSIARGGHVCPTLISWVGAYIDCSPTPPTYLTYLSMIFLIIIII